MARVKIKRLKKYLKANKTDYTTLLLLTGLLAFFTSKALDSKVQKATGSRSPAQIPAQQIKVD